MKQNFIAGLVDLNNDPGSLEEAQISEAILKKIDDYPLSVSEKNVVHIARFFKQLAELGDINPQVVPAVKMYISALIDSFENLTNKALNEYTELICEAEDQARAQKEAKGQPLN